MWNTFDVTHSKADLATGPFWEFNELAAEKLPADFTFDPTSPTNTGVCLGDSSTDGFDNDTSATINKATVWGGAVRGTSVSDYSETYTVRFASTTNADVNKFMYGDDKVSGTTAIKVLHSGTARPVKTFMILARTDDGRRDWRIIPRAQVDISSLSPKFNEGDITVYEVKLNALYFNADGDTHYSLTEVADAKGVITPSYSAPVPPKG